MTIPNGMLRNCRIANDSGGNRFSLLVERQHQGVDCVHGINNLRITGFKEA